MNSETVNLIATDPPFNTRRNRSGTAGFYVDNWKWGDTGKLPDQWAWNEVHPAWLEEIRDENRALYEVIEATEHCHGKDIAAFLCFLSVRLLEMHRVLKPNGSIYLHCDHTANAYIRMALDAIFGNRNFRNEVVWKRSNPKNDSRQFRRSSDRIMFYSKGNTWTFNPPRMSEKNEETTDTWFNQKDSKGRYCQTVLTGPGVSTGDSGKPWREIDPSPRHWAVPQKLTERFEKETSRKLAGDTRQRLEQLAQAGYIDFNSRGNPSWRRYDTDVKAPIIQDMWQDDDVKTHTKNSKRENWLP